MQNRVIEDTEQKERIRKDERIYKIKEIDKAVIEKMQNKGE